MKLTKLTKLTTLAKLTNYSRISNSCTRTKVYVISNRYNCNESICNIGSIVKIAGIHNMLNIPEILSIVMI